MNITVKGYFKLDAKKNYVVLDKHGNEVGTLDVQEDPIKFCKEDEPDVEFTTEAELEAWFEENDYSLSSDSVRWIEYNPNPLSKKTNDCSIRAYCAAENIPWEEAYDTACKYGKDTAMMPNDASTCKKILEEEYGYTFKKFKKEQKGKTVNEVAIDHPVGTFVLDCPGHLVTIIDGEYYDSWDSGKKKVRGIYVKERVD